MFVYLVAFLLTFIFINRATFYYNKIAKVRQAASAGTGRNINTQRNKELTNVFKFRYALFFFLAFFPLFFIAAVRYNVGTDYSFTYVPNFLRILNGETPYSEWGFNKFNRFIQLFTDDPQWLFISTSLIFTFVLIQTIVRYSSNPSVSVAVVLLSCVFFVFLNNMRQLIAVILFFRAFPYIKNRKFLEFLICMLLGLLFHLSAVLMIFPYIFVNFKYVRKHFIRLAVVVTLAVPVFAKLLQLVLMQTKYNYFFVSHFNNGNATVTNILYNLFFFVISYMVLRKKIKTDKTAYVLLFMQFLAFWISSFSLFLSISELISRITVYFQVFQILLVPYCVKVQKDTTGKVAYLASYVVAYGIYLIYFIILNGYHQVLPYQWIF